MQTAIDRLRGSLLERMHWVDADEPEECPWGFMDCVSFLGQAAAWAAGRKPDAITTLEQTQPRRVMHLSYPSLISDPVDAVASVFHTLDIPADPLIEGRIGDYLGEQQAGKRATAPRELDSFGLDHEEFLTRPSIAVYCRRNGIQPEIVRLTG